MRTLLLVLHIGAAIVFVGPATFATSAFVRYAAAESLGVARALHRVSRLYGGATLAVPIVGLVLAALQGYLTQGWLLVSLVLFFGAMGLLMQGIVPAQARAVAAIEAGGSLASRERTLLRATAAAFAVAWVVVLALMVAKPF